MTKRKVIYTATFGNFDEVKNPTIDLPGWDLLFFTDANLKSNRWNIINVKQREDLDSIKMSRCYKMFPHLYLKDYDLSLWIDASILICKPIDEFVNYITDDVKMGIYQHTSSWKEEISVMHRWCKDIKFINSIMLEYQNEGFDINKKIMSGNIILREHNDKNVIQTMELWWKQFNKHYIKRDQISLAYSLWKSGLNINFFDGFHPRGQRNDYFKSLPHKRTNKV